MNDPSREDQLISGFYPPESNAWRWTKRKFAVILSPPPGSEQKGGVLRLSLYISAGQIKKAGPMTLSAKAGDYVLQPETYTAAGPYLYTRDLPPEVLDTNILPVQFTFDKATAPSERDARELAAVVTAVELRTKLTP